MLVTVGAAAFWIIWRLFNINLLTVKNNSSVSSEKVEKKILFFVSFKVTMLNENRWFKSEKT